MGYGFGALPMIVRRTQIPAVPVGWLVFTATMIVVCLAMTFPYDSLQAMLLLRLSERTGWDICAERGSLQPPAGMEWLHPSILAPGLARLDAERIQIQIRMSSILRGQPVFL